MNIPYNTELLNKDIRRYQNKAINKDLQTDGNGGFYVVLTKSFPANWGICTAKQLFYWAGQMKFIAVGLKFLDRNQAVESEERIFI